MVVARILVNVRQVEDRLGAWPLLVLSSSCSSRYGWDRLPARGRLPPLVPNKDMGVEGASLLGLRCGGHTRAQTYARSAECAGEGDDTVRQHTMTRRRCLCPVKIVMANAQRRARTALQELRLDRKDAPLVAENLRTWHRTQPGRNTALAGMVTARSHYTPSMARFPTLCQITPSAFQQIPLSDDTAACAVARPCSSSV